MAKRYAALSDDLEKLSIHYKLDEKKSLARDLQLAASELRTAEHIPPDPSRLTDISKRVRDPIAEWRAFGSIPELERLEEERPYLTRLTRVKSLGPVTAKQLHESKNVETLDDLEALLDSGEIEDVTGIGSKTATTFRRSVAQLDRDQHL